MALSKVDPNFLNVSQVGGRRNLIINGAMQVAQRGTSFTASGFSLDRWYHQLSGGTSTTTQETFSLGSEVAGCSKYLRQDTSTGDNYCGLVYKVEDVKSIHQGKVTFSFYAKGTNPAGGNFTVRLARINSGSTFFDTPLNSTLTLTSTWQRFVYTFDVASFSGMGTIDNTSHLYISIHQADGDAGTAAWQLNLTGVQLEVGDTATLFEHRSYGEELALCQRYFQTFVNPLFVGIVPDNTARVYDAGIIFQPQMRSTPTASISNTGSSNGQGVNDGQNSAYITSLLSTGGTKYGMELNFNISTDLTDYRIASFSGGGSTTNQTTYNFDAEL